MPDLPTQDEVLAYFQSLSNWELWEFLITINPLRIEGGTGSLANPVAVF